MQDFRLRNVGRRPKQERMSQAAAPETRSASSLEDQLFGAAETPAAGAWAVPEVLGLAGPVRRVLAVLLNGVFFVLVAVGVVMVAVMFSLPVDDRATGVLLGIICAVYFGGQAFSMARSGQSWGKRLLGVKVVDEVNRPLGWGRLLFGRELPWLPIMLLLPFLGWLVPLVCVVMLFSDRRRQTLQDKLAKTVVVRV